MFPRNVPHNITSLSSLLWGSCRLVHNQPRENGVPVTSPKPAFFLSNTLIMVVCHHDRSQQSRPRVHSTALSIFSSNECAPALLGAEMHLHYRGLQDHGFKQHHLNKFITPRTLGLKNTHFSFRDMVQRWTRGGGERGTPEACIATADTF